MTKEEIYFILGFFYVGLGVIFLAGFLTMTAATSLLLIGLAGCFLSGVMIGAGISLVRNNR